MKNLQFAVLFGAISVLHQRLADTALVLSPAGTTITSIAETATDGTPVPDSTYSTSGQGAGALYYYSLTILPNPADGNEPFRLVQGMPSSINVASIEVQNPPGLDYEATAQWTLRIFVQDLADPAAGSKMQTLTVDITDVSEPPRFLNLPGSGSVRELVTAPEVVKFVSVSDDENAANSSGLTVSIQSITPPGGPFQIAGVAHNTPTPGVAVVTIENTANPGLNYESGTTTWELIIEAEDIDSQTSTATLTVNVLDENEPMYISNLPDTQVVGEIMNGQIFAVEVIDVDVNATIPPTFTMTTSPASGPFTIDGFGNVNLVPPGLDYATQPTWTLTITISDADGYNDTKPLYIEVTEQNSGPIIMNLPDTTGISEDEAGGTSVFTVAPFDVDGDAVICTFSPNPMDGNFVFNSTTYEVRLVDTPSLNYEVTPSYDITVTCNDGQNYGPPARLTVTVSPMNEPPQILSLPATVSVPEDAINAADISLVDGYDIDGDALTFAILSVTPSSGQEKFSISDTGTDDAHVGIVDKPNFDYEDINQYIIVVEATDGEYTATGTLNVDIVDVNEPPEFFIKPQTLYLDENTPTNTILSAVVLLTTDPDDAQADLEFAMVPNAYSSFFNVTQDPRLTVASPMDYEVGYPEPFVIQLLVTDSAGNADYLSIDVYLVNVNDNPPVFTEDTYLGDVKENAPGGTSVLSVLATDVEGDSVVYKIDPFSLYVDVDETTGEVRLKQPLNHETLGPMIQVSVTATDDGVPPLQDVAYVNITIEDVNDNKPVMEKRFYNWEVRYDADVGTYIDKVTASDGDLGNSGQFTFSLLVNNANFDVDDVGKVSVKERLQAGMQYLLYCLAEDSGDPSQTSEVSVIRIDAFIPQLMLLNVHVGISVDDFNDVRRTALLSTLNGLYPPWQFRISAVKSEDVVTSSRRRLLASNAVLEMYALIGDFTDSLGNVTLTKEFVFASILFNAMTIDDTGTPSAVLAGTDIVLVEPTYPVEVVVYEINWWLDTLEGNITIGVLCGIGFLLLLILLIICCWKCCCRGRGGCKCCKRSKSDEADISDVGTERESHQIPTQQAQVEENPSMDATNVRQMFQISKGRSNDGFQW